MLVPRWSRGQVVRPCIFRPERGKGRGQNARLLDRMTHSPLDDLLHACRRAGASWLALVALLGNILLPAALSTFVLKEPGDLKEPGRDIPGVGLCGVGPSDAPGKTKSGLLVQHCPLCTEPAAPLPQPPSIATPGLIADESRPQLLTTLSVAPIRHGRVQARAPPSAA